MNHRHQKANQSKTNGKNASAKGKIAKENSGNGKTTAESREGPPYDSKINDWFRLFAHKSSALVGCAGSFALAVFVLLAWAVSGPFFGFSDTWQLVINTATTIVTFLMVFLIQNTQNRDAKAIHLKLDELIRSIKGARNRMMDLEDMSEGELNKFQEAFKRLGEARSKSHEKKSPS